MLPHKLGEINLLAVFLSAIQSFDVTNVPFFKHILLGDGKWVFYNNVDRNVIKIHNI